MKFSAAQRRIINSRANGIKVIQGESGCGKTDTAINRAFKLQQLCCACKDDEILIAAKDNEHLNELSKIHENIEKKAAIQKSFFDEENKKKLEINDINSLILLYFNKYNSSNKVKYAIADSEQVREIVKESVCMVKKDNNSRFKKIQFLNEDFIDFFAEEIKWIKGCGFTKAQDYYNADRSSIINAVYDSNGKLINMRRNSKGRECVFKVMEIYNNLLKEKNLVDFEDAAIYAYKECRKKRTKKYTHIIIDEVQSFTKVELMIIDALCNKREYSTMTFVLDTDKMKESTGWINKKKKFSDLGYNIKGKTVTLKEKYNDSQSLVESSFNSARKQSRRKIREIRKHAEANNMQYAYNWLDFDLFNLECGRGSVKNDDIITHTVNSIDDNANNDALSEGNTVKYIDLNRNVCHELISDFYESGEVYTSDDNFKEKVEDLVNIPVFNEIAAGSPILMNDEIEYSCNLPKEWVRSSKDLFILKIKGDSMVNKNINDGDHVLINKGRYPSNNDIVAVEIEGEATLKTLKIKSRKIILKPENDKYDPIILDGGQEYSILGVAVGILKNFA